MPACLVKSEEGNTNPIRQALGTFSRKLHGCCVAPSLPSMRPSALRVSCSSRQTISSRTLCSCARTIDFHPTWILPTHTGPALQRIPYPYPRPHPPLPPTGATRHDGHRATPRRQLIPYPYGRQQLSQCSDEPGRSRASMWRGALVLKPSDLEAARADSRHSSSNVCTSQVHRSSSIKSTSKSSSYSIRQRDGSLQMAFSPHKTLVCASSPL